MRSSVDTEDASARSLGQIFKRPLRGSTDARPTPQTMRFDANRRRVAKRDDDVVFAAGQSDGTRSGQCLCRPDGPAPHASPFAGDPFFEQFFRPAHAQPHRAQSSLGSGVIVEARGIVVTNNHVIEGADDIRVALADGREFESRYAAQG
jgi:S1-C subfamily serine protease